jgi:threonine/homoserine/homoserine lactone efflux protein
MVSAGVWFIVILFVSIGVLIWLGWYLLARESEKDLKNQADPSKKKWT